jgi:transcriptional regulator with XRE-family HTH domain
MLEELSQLDRYPWTGHAGMVRKNRYDWHAVDEVLCLFGETRGKARKAYREFIRVGVTTQHIGNYSGGGLIRSSNAWEAADRQKREHVRCIGDERILGSSQFVEVALTEDELQIELKTLRRQQGWTLDKIIEDVCEFYGIPEQQLGTKARRNKLSLAKSLICYWGVEELGLTLTAIGRRLGISQQAVSKWVTLGREYCRSEDIDIESLTR